MKTICRIMGRNDATAETAAELVKHNEKTADDLDGPIEKLKDDIWDLEQEQKAVERRDTTLRQLEASLQKALSVSLIEQNLIRAAEKRIQNLEAEAAQFEDTKEMDAVRERFDRLREVLDCVAAAEAFGRSLKEKSSIEVRMEFIDTQIAELEELEASLKTLRDVLGEYQTTLTQQALVEFQAAIDQYYGSLLGHPHFQRIRIEALSGDPVKYDIKAADAKGTSQTHIHTRFSTAQTNAAALAIFFAVNQKLAELLPVLILDDPAQNMDVIHKEALAKTVASVAKSRQLIIATHEKQFTEQVLAMLGAGIALHLLRTELYSPNLVLGIYRSIPLHIVDYLESEEIRTRMSLHRFRDALRKVDNETQKSCVNYLLGITVDADSPRLFRDVDTEKNELILKPQTVRFCEYARERMRERERERLSRA